MSKKAIKSWYGNKPLWRAFCPNCNSNAIVIKGVLQCCDKQLSLPREQTTQRVAGGARYRKLLSRKQEDDILNRQNYRCIYCDSYLKNSYYLNSNNIPISIRINYDHFKPWAYDQDSNYENFVASCHRCNHIKHSKYFDTIEEAREYILMTRDKIGDFYGPELEREDSKGS
jgi:5-methylcytosine-specific restriction endonuclease McrA